jgi:hypothetical protein
MLHASADNAKNDQVLNMKVKGATSIKSFGEKL